jgi:hypothetical protein
MQTYYKAMRPVGGGAYRSRRGDPAITYTVGGTYSTAAPVLCASGFHACHLAVDCWAPEYGYNAATDVLAVVLLSGGDGDDTDGVLTDGVKVAGQCMTILRVLRKEDMLQLCLEEGAWMVAAHWRLCVWTRYAFILLPAYLVLLLIMIVPAVAFSRALMSTLHTVKWCQRASPRLLPCVSWYALAAVCLLLCPKI